MLDRRDTRWVLFRGELGKYAKMYGSLNKYANKYARAKNDQGVSIMMMLTPCFIWCSRLESNQWPVP